MPYRKASLAEDPRPIVKD